MYRLFLLLFCCGNLSAQNLTKKVLFLGNSYTGVNNLPQLTANFALSAGDSLIFDSNTPGGHTLQGHSGNATSLGKIALGDWDFVVLQEQSQLPSFSDAQVQISVFPYTRILDSIIIANNPCAETVFYMTWGRKNGDASNCANFPPVCTYMGMDSMLRLRYSMMAEDNAAILAPVGAVWRYLRQQHPLIELYQTDESHPSVAGSYAAAATFYTVLFRKNPTLVSFNSSLSATDAAIIRAAAKTVVFDSLLHWNVGAYDPAAAFGFSINGNELTLSDSSAFAASHFWDFGDGNTSNDQHPVHNYDSSGTYIVSLIVENCGLADTLTQVISISIPSSLHGNENAGISLFPNPADDELILNAGSELFGSNFTVYNSSGIALLSGKISSEQTLIDIKVLLPGIYYLRAGERTVPLRKK